MMPGTRGDARVGLRGQKPWKISVKPWMFLLPYAIWINEDPFTFCVFCMQVCYFECRHAARMFMCQNVYSDTFMDVLWAKTQISSLPRTAPDADPMMRISCTCGVDLCLCWHCQVGKGHIPCGCPSWPGHCFVSFMVHVLLYDVPVTKHKMLHILGCIIEP